jgi:hypothetical protein
MRRVGAVLITAIVGASALAGCGGSDSQSKSDDKPAPAGRHFSVEAALRELPLVKPADDQPLQVFTGDLTEAARLGDLPKPVGERSTSAWLNGLRGPRLSVPASEGLGLQRFQTGAMRKVLGFDVRDVQTFASVESLPREVTVVRLADGAKLKDGVTATGPGKLGDIDPSKVSDAPFTFIYGVTQQGDHVALGKTPQLLTDWKNRGDSSLADNDAFLDVAKALDAQAVYGAILSDRPAPLPPLSAEMLNELNPSIPKFNAVGIAQGVEDGEPVEYVAYQFDDARQARDRVQETWEDGVSYREYRSLGDLVDVEDITVKGHVVIVKISPKLSPGLAIQMLTRSDTPFIVID